MQVGGTRVPGDGRSVAVQVGQAGLEMVVLQSEAGTKVERGRWRKAMAKAIGGKGMEQINDYD